MQRKYTGSLSKIAVYVKAALVCIALAGMAGCEHDDPEDPSIPVEIKVGYDAAQQTAILEKVIFGQPVKTTANQNREIVLSAYGITTPTYTVHGDVARISDRPQEIVLSASDAYSYVEWYIDDATSETARILTVVGSKYTLRIPHTITFVGRAADGRFYSETIQFTVEP